MRVLALLLQLVAAQAPQISQERIEEGHYRLRLFAPGLSNLEAAQALLTGTARQLCGSLEPHFGHYEWMANEQVATPSAPPSGLPTAPSLALIQDLYCGTAPPAPPETIAPPDPNWRQSEVQEQQILARARAYLDARNAGRWPVAWAMLTPQTQAETTFDRWSQEAADFNRQAGAARAARNMRVTWYNNPPQAPVPGLYAAVDYDGDYAGAHFMCGYTVWSLQRDGSWRLVSEMRSSAMRESAPNASPEQVREMRAQAHCND